MCKRIMATDGSDAVNRGPEETVMPSTVMPSRGRCAALRIAHVILEQCFDPDHVGLSDWRGSLEAGVDWPTELTVPLPTASPPTVPLPTVPLPTVPLPTVPLPTVPLPTVPLPTVRHL